MATVLVTGGTGMLGRKLVPRLIDRGHHVRVLARRPATADDRAEAVQGNVVTGEGIAEALDGVDTVVHAATNAQGRARRTEVVGTRNMLEALDGSGVHLVYVSIVGVDRNRLPYYKAKWAAEQLVEASSVPWTIQRATQFHDLIDTFLALPVFPVTRNLAFQVVDSGEVASRLADHVEAGACGRADDFGGPEVIKLRELAATRRRITGRRARLVPAPRLGPLRDLDEGLHHCPDHRAGHITWEAWLGGQT